MPSREFAEWWAYLELTAKERQQAEAAASARRR